MENETALMKKARALHKELQTELLKLEKTQQQSAENETILKELSHQVDAIKTENDKITDRRETLKADYSKLTREKSDLQTEIQQKVQAEKDRIIPLIERTKSEKAVLEQEIKMDEQLFEREQERIAALRKEIEELQAQKAKKKQEFEEQQQIYLAEKDEPMRIEKGNTNLSQAVKHLEVENSDLEKTRSKYVHETEIQHEGRVRNLETMEASKQQQKELSKHFQDYNNAIRLHDMRQKELSYEKTKFEEDNYNLDNEIKAMERQKKDLQETKNSLNKQNNDQLKTYRKLNQELIDVNNEIKELDNKLTGVNKETAELDAQDKELEKETQRLLDEQHIFVG